MHSNRRCYLIAAVLLSAAPLALPQNQSNLPPEKVAVVYGQNIRYVEAGQGPAVILLHGLGATKEVWSANFGSLSAKYHVYAIDQLGFGHSDKPLIEYVIGTWVDFLQSFMQAQNIPRATVVGNSLGGWIALEFTIRHPEMVDKLVLVDAAGLTWGQSSRRIDLNPATVAGWRMLLESLFFDKAMVTDRLVLQVFAEHMRNNDGYTIDRTMAGFGQASFEDDKLKTVKAPTLVVWGRQDELIGVDRAEKFRDGIAGAKLAVFDQCGHIPQVEKAAEFNQTVIDFLAK